MASREERDRRVAAEIRAGIRIEDYADDELRALARELEGLLDAALAAALNKGFDAMRAELGVAFDASDPDAIRFLRGYYFDLVKGMTRDLAPRLRDSIIQSVEEGLGVRDSKRLVRGVGQYGEWRSRVIARTESNRAFNYGRMRAAKDSGIVRGKVFIATTDDRVRDGHLAADGDEAPLDSTFNAGDAAGYQFPPIAPNCRCAWLPVTKNYDPRDTDDWVAHEESMERIEQQRLALTFQVESVQLQVERSTESAFLEAYWAAWRALEDRVLEAWVGSN